MLHAHSWTLECHQPCKKKTKNTTDEDMQSQFVVIPHCYKYRRIAGKLKGIISPTVSLSLRLFWIFFNPLLVHLGKIPVMSFWVRVTEKFSKCTPRHLRERECSPPLATVCVTIYVPAAVECQCGRIPRMVSRIAKQNTTKMWATWAVSSLTCCEG